MLKTCLICSFSFHPVYVSSLVYDLPITCKFIKVYFSSNVTDNFISRSGEYHSEENQRIESIIPPRRESKVPKNGERKYEIGIPPFAMSTYKMHGVFWVNPKTADHEMMVSYQRAAWFWLRGHNFSHRDYNFFVSHGI